mmetsp:Transcript_30455/g.71157  ORF Transcript_30455/g.71157 Transcript_30455/m.71157 type:complete len:467 (-) Transcript_30455:143-1543(-)
MSYAGHANLRTRPTTLPPYTAAAAAARCPEPPAALLRCSPRAADLVADPLNLLEVNAVEVHLPKRRHLPQPRHVPDCELRRVVHLRLGGEAPDPEADRRVREVLVDAERPEHVGGLQRRRCASATRRDGHLFEGHQQALPLHVGEAQVQVPGVPPLLVPVEEHLGHRLGDVLVHLVGKALGVVMVPLHLLLGDPGRRPHPDSHRSGHRPAAEAPLLPAAVDDGLHADAGPAADVEGANTLGAVDLVARDRCEVQVPLGHVHLDLSGRLCNVRVEEDLVGAADLADLLHGLDDANLVVDRHHAAQHRVGADGSLELLEVHDAVLLHRQIGNLEALLLQHTARVQDALVLRLRGDDVLLLALVEASNTLDRHVVALSRTRSPYDLLGVCSDQRRNLCPCLLHRTLRLPAIVVAPRMRVPVLPRHQGQHCVQNARVHGGGALVVEERGPPLRRLPHDAEVGRLTPCRHF